MAKVRVRPESGNLYLDFSYRGHRCREQTALPDTATNRRAVESLAAKIARAIAHGRFNYRDFFPDSPRAARWDESGAVQPASASSDPVPSVLLGDFAEAWFEENRPRWRETHAETVRGTLDQHVLPAFRDRNVGSISRADLLAFRAGLGRKAGRSGEPLSPSRINHIMAPLRMLLAEASERHGFASPFRGIKPLRLPRLDIQPFSLEEVNLLLETVRQDWRPYLAVRFFTGLRTGEVNGLEWKHLDFDQDLVLVRQSIVNGRVEGTKTDGSMRDIPMVPVVRQALLEQRERAPEECRWVFSQRNGKPINLVNFTNRVWHPLLRQLGLERRRPYQTRHTAATLMLGSGENPEWVARTLGHSNTEMLFRVYSRYVPNLTRNDGRAFTGLASAATGTGPTKGGLGSALPASLALLSRAQLEALLRELADRGQGSGA